MGPELHGDLPQGWAEQREGGTVDQGAGRPQLPTGIQQLRGRTLGTSAEAKGLMQSTASTNKTCAGNKKALPMAGP
jgi:hypothetical protein